MNKPLYKLVATNDCQYGTVSFSSGQVLTQMDQRVVFGGEWGWAVADGNAEWQDNVSTLAEVAAAKLAELKSSRNTAESATPFVFDGSQFDYDSLSRERINAAVSAATIAAVSGTATTAVICEWILYDNSKRQMTVGDWLAFRQAEVERSAECHARYNTLKAQVEAATTAAEVNAVSW